MIGILIRSDVVENSFVENHANGDHPPHVDEVRTVGIEGQKSRLVQKRVCNLKTMSGNGYSATRMLTSYHSQLGTRN